MNSAAAQKKSFDPAATSELKHLALLMRVLDRMPEGARGRAMRYLGSRYLNEYVHCGKYGEP
jgi:hypothetical protein